MASSLPFDYQIVRSRRRRTVALRVDRGQVQVRVPALADERWIESWVRSKVDWILPRLAQQRAALACNGIHLEQGAHFLFRGTPLRLEWQRGARSQVRVKEARLQVILSARIRRPEPEAVRALLRRWMASQAQALLPSRILQLGRQLEMLPSAVEVRDYRRKWGQCAADGRISLNWRLLHLPVELSDHVLIHELCHLQQMNHGPAFWSLMAACNPDYRQQRARLQQYSPLLIW